MQVELSKLVEFEQFFNGEDQKMKPTIEDITPPKVHAPLLHGQCEPNVLLQKEQPSHRAAIELSAKGYTGKEIGLMLGRTGGTITNALKQPFNRQLLADEIRRIQGTDEEVVEIIKSNVANAVRRLASIVNNPETKNSDAVAAAEALLNRRYGKPNQPVNRETGVDLDSMTIAEVASQLPRTDQTGTNK